MDVCNLANRHNSRFFHFCICIYFHICICVYIYICICVEKEIKWWMFATQPTDTPSFVFSLVFAYILISVFVVLLVFIFITLFVFVLRRKLSGGCLQFSRPTHLPLYLHNAFIFLPLLQFTFIISKTHKISVVR